MREIANRRTWFDDSSTWYWEKNSEQKLKKIEKISIMKTSIFRRLVLKKKKILKSTNHKIFRMFWMKQKTRTSLQQKMSIERSISLNIKRLSKQQYENLKHFIQIQQKKLKSIINRNAVRKLMNQWLTWTQKIQSITSSIKWTKFSKMMRYEKNLCWT